MSAKVVERVFEVFALHYGAPRMEAHWRGQEPGKVKAFWASRLSGLSRGAMRYALENLPEFPPTPTEFAAIARQYRPLVPPNAGLLGSPKDDDNGRRRAAEIASKYGSKAMARAREDAEAC